MKRLLFVSICSLLLLASVNLSAQIPQYIKALGNGGNYFPMGEQSNGNNKVQWVYLAGDFPGSYYGLITDVYFKINSAYNPPASATAYTNLTVKIGHVSFSTFSNGTFITSLMTVALYPSYTIINTATGSWFKIHLTTPFLYDPTQNFVIELSHGGYTGSGFYIEHSYTTANTRIYGNVTSATGSVEDGFPHMGIDMIPRKHFPDVTGDGSYCSDSGDINLEAHCPHQISDTTGNYSFLWTGPNGFTSSDSTLKLPKIAGPSGPSGTYNVMVLSYPAAGGGSGIPDTSGITTVSIYVQQTPNPPQVPYLISYCQGATPDTIPVYGQDIKWYSVREGGTATTSQPVINTSVPGSFTYYLSQAVGSCESKRASVTVQVVPPAPPPIVISPVTYCQNDIPLPLEAVGQNLLWYSSDTALVGTPVIPTPSTSAQDTLTWYVTQTINGCESSRVPIEVHINYRPNALVLASRDYVCAGDTLVISYYGNADGDPSVTFNWTFPKGCNIISGSGQGPYIIRFDSAGNRRITLIADNEGCASPQTHYDVEVRVIPEFTLNIQESACQGDLVNLVINQITPAIDVFVWDIAGGEKVYASETAGPYGVKWNNPGSKTITVIATDNACVSPAVQDEIFIRPLPDARITRFGDKVCAGDSIQLEGLYSPDYSYQWLPEQFFPESNSYRQWAKIDYARDITLNVTDIYNCKASSSIWVTPENCCVVSFPTAFTPNEDSRNDVFRPITQGNQKITKFVVKNRWGQQVFESADDRRGWDGKLGGIPQDMDVYFYYIKYQCSDGKYYEERGDVMLMR